MDPKSRIARFIRFVMRDVTYHKQYPSTVKSQSGMTLDLLPDDAKIAGPGLGAVPLRVGLPGFTVEVPEGARVLLTFDNGDPSIPAAQLFDPGSVKGITFADGTQAVARQGDLVIAGGVGLLVTLVPLPPAVPAPPNAAVVCGVPHMISFSAVPPTPLKADPLYGSIATGRQEFQS